MTKFNYSVSTIQYSMISDKLRTDTYHDAIKKLIKTNDIVVDLGSGSGILSLLASKYSKKVYSIEITNIIEEAKKIAILNNIQNIEFIKEDIFNVSLKDKVDIIIHEQIGDYLWDEDLINKISYFKNNFLNDNGIIIPNIIELYLVPSDYELYAEKVMNYWDSEPYGFNFSSLKKLTFKEQIKNYRYPSLIKLENDKTYLSKPKNVYKLNLLNDDNIPELISSSFTFDTDSVLTGVVGFMKVRFTQNLSFYTNHYNPSGELTHWRQFFIPMFSPKKVSKGEQLDFKLVPNIDSDKWSWEFNFK